MSLKAVFISLILGTNILTLQNTQEWLDDVEKAQELAQQRQRPLLIAFLGPDWCPCSDKLDEEILSSQTFLTALSKELVFARVNVPENFDQETFQGFELKEKLQVTECPCLVLIDPSGKEIAKFGALSMNSKEFASHIKEVLAAFKQVKEHKNSKHIKADELKTLYMKAGKLADSTFKRELLKEGLKIDRDPYFLLEQYGELIAKGEIKNRQLRRVRSKILAQDPNNEYGYCRQIALMDFEALAKKVKPQKTETVVKPLIEYLQKFGGKDLQNAWKLEMKISQYFFSHNESKEALKHAQASLKIAPESAQKEVEQSIEYLQMYVQ